MPRVRTDPQRWRSYNGLGILADRRGGLCWRNSTTTGARCLQPDNASVVNNRGYSHYLAGNSPARRQTSVRPAARARPRHLDQPRARSLAKQGRYEEALESLLKETDTAHAYNTLGEVAREVGDLRRGTELLHARHQRGAALLPGSQENLAKANAATGGARLPIRPGSRARHAASTVSHAQVGGHRGRRSAACRFPC